MGLEIKRLRQIFHADKEEMLKEYFSFLKFQSISSEPSYKEQVLACANWVAAYLKESGFDVDIWPTAGHPTIFASNMRAGPTQPTLLLYNHYDVQPVDPLELWQTPPFEPTERNGQIYARGAQDNKGQCLYNLLALKALSRQEGGLPINVKLCIEGEEECGSAGLSALLHEKQSALQADYLAIVDMGLQKPDQPAITLGVRGLIAMDVEVTGTATDLHSGSHGGVAYNPIHALVALLARLRDDMGKITIEGFYDDIVPLSPEERAPICFAFDEKSYEATFGARPTGGEHTLPPLERNWLRPTLEINGIYGGYAGEGLKTVIPAKAMAKISCRLVPNQDPEKVGRQVAAYLRAHAPEGVKVAVHLHPGSGKALRTRADSQVVKAFAKAYEEVFRRPCEFIYSGGSIPIACKLAEACRGEVLLLGMGLPDDCIHAPNEHFGIDRIEKGFLTIARAIQLLRRAR